MNVLDESIREDQRQFLQDWRIAVRQIGYDIGRDGMKDDQVILLLQQLRHPTFFTPDSDYYKRRLCHAQYCLVFLDIGPLKLAEYIRRVLRHPEFNTAAKRMGAVLRITPTELTVWRLHTIQPVEFGWSK